MNRLDNEDISRMVIKVFFEEDVESKQNYINRKSKRRDIMTWKAWKLDYLRSIQIYNFNSNKRTRGSRFLYNMFVARKFIPRSYVKIIYDIVDHKIINNINDKIKSGSNENHVCSVLTNFAVNNDARLSGVLVESCKDTILTLYPTEYNEIKLEVKEENLFHNILT